MDKIMMSGSLMGTMKSAEIKTVYEEPWSQFVADMREAHERVLGPTLEDKENNSLFSVGVFQGGQWTSKTTGKTSYYPEGVRDGDHLIHCGLLGFDYDGKSAADPYFLTADEFSRRMKGVLHLTYSTHSSTLERPKFRAFLAIDRRLVGQEYKDLSRFIADIKYPAHTFDSASFDATRGFFLSCHNSDHMDAAFFHAHEGKPIGVDSWLNEFYRRRDIELADREEERAAREARAQARSKKSKGKSKTTSPRVRAVNYCLAVPQVERSTMLSVGCKLLREFGSDIAEDVWREHIASRYISDSRGGKSLTEDEAKSSWRWIEEHTTINNKERNNAHETQIHNPDQ
jgi:hypothetical protein